MTAVRALPRLWDGQRLLRFLAGLALIALAFAAHAGLTTASSSTAPPALTPPATAVIDVPTAPAADLVPTVDAVPEADSTAELAPATHLVPAAEAPATGVIGVPDLGPGRAAPGAGGVVPGGAALTAYLSRGPPVA